jgi:hypothetical protein
MFPLDHSGPVSFQPVHRQRGRNVAGPGGPGAEPVRDVAAGGVEGEARELGTGKGNRPRRGAGQRGTAHEHGGRREEEVTRRR